MKSVMGHSFSRVPQANIRRSSFDRSHGVKTTFDSGDLIPIFVDEALPGDTFNLKTNLFARMSTPIYPVMDNAYLELFYFAVPIRLIWDNFVKMMGEQENPGDTVDYRVPQFTSAAGVGEGNIGDHFGIPPGVASTEVSALPFRAYNLIWNEWFRDQNLQDSLDVPKTDGPDTNDGGEQLYGLQKRGKRHDYFTSALPWPQKGDAVELPITGDIPVFGGSDVGDANDFFKQGGKGFNLHTANTGEPDSNVAILKNTGGTNVDDVQMEPNMYAQLDNSTQITINSLRQAFQVQAMYEKDARGGTRYTELVRSHFGVVSPDARLQRPEFLGGGSSRINMNPLASTADTSALPDSGRQLGGMSAIATTSQNGSGFTKSFTEHTIIIGLANVRTDLTYQQGLNRMWSRRDKLDFYWPALATIGEQEIKNKEIFYQGTSDDDLVFGYQERFAEYRYKPSEIHGAFRSGYTGTLDSWHYSQNFENLPTLSDTFIEDSPPIARTLAVQGEPEIICDMYHQLYCTRPMPMFGIPYNMGRF